MAERDILPGDWVGVKLQFKMLDDRCLPGTTTICAAAAAAAAAPTVRPNF